MSHPSVPSRPSGRHSQRMEEAARLPNPHRKARPNSYLQQGRLSLRRMEEAARSVSHFRSHFRTHFRTTSLSVPARPSGPHPRRMEEAGQLPNRKASPTSYLQPSCLRSEPKEAAAPLANPWVTASPCARFQQLKEEAAPLANPPSNPTVHLQQHCARPEPTEEEAPLARHPYWAPSQPVLREAPQARAQEQLQKIEAVPAGELQRGQRLCQPGEAGPPPPTVPSARSAAGPRWLKTAP